MEPQSRTYPPRPFAGRTRAAVTRQQLLPGRNAAPSAADLCIALAVASAPAIFLSIGVSRYGFDGLPMRILAGLTVYVNFMIVLRNLNYGLALFIVAAALSPRLPGFYNNLRVEDLVFTIVFAVWFIKALQHGRIPLVHSPIVLPFVLLTLMSFASTLWGSSLGLIPDEKYSFFLQAKRIEYFLIFCVVATTVRSEGWLRLLTLTFIVSGALAAAYGLATASGDSYLTVANERVNGPEGENYNTLSGYLVVCIGAGLAAIAAYPRGRTRTLLIVCTGVAGLGLLLSYSREGYLMLMGSLLVFGFTRHRLLLLGAGLALFAAIVLAAPVRKNIGETIQLIGTSHQDDPGSNSLTARYRAWEWRWSGWFIKQPLIGSGVGSVALTVDNEYLMRACEVGIIGFSLFLWWLAAIWKQIRRLHTAPGLAQVLALGLAAGFVGLLIQGCVAATFTTIRTMEPFWYLLGLVTAAGQLARRHQPVTTSPEIHQARRISSASAGTSSYPGRPISRQRTV